MLSLRSFRPGGSRVLLFAALASGWSCASEEIPKYGDPARVAGGVGGEAGTSSAGGDAGTGGAAGTGPCTVNTGCAVSFKNDIFPAFDTVAKCATDSLCHGPGGEKDGLSLTAGDPASYYKALTEYVVPDPPGPAGKYIEPCYPDKSQLPCNLAVSDGANPHTLCGKLMPPKASNGVTLEQLQKIEDWITCGAPDN